MTNLRAQQSRTESVVITWVAPSPAPPRGYHIVVESANINVNVNGTSYTAMMPPGRHTIQVLPLSLHYPSEAVSVELTVHDIGKILYLVHSLFSFCFMTRSS